MYCMQLRKRPLASDSGVHTRNNVVESAYAVMHCRRENTSWKKIKCVVVTLAETETVKQDFFTEKVLCFQEKFMYIQQQKNNKTCKH